MSKLTSLILNLFYLAKTKVALLHPISLSTLVNNF